MTADTGNHFDRELPRFLERRFVRKANGSVDAQPLQFLEFGVCSDRYIGRIISSTSTGPLFPHDLGAHLYDDWRRKQQHFHLRLICPPPSFNHV